MAFHEIEFTPWEAAYIADLPHREVQKAYDEGWFDRPSCSDAGVGAARRHLGVAEVTHLRAVKDVSGAVLTNEAKKAVHRHLRECLPDLMITVSQAPETDTNKPSGCYLVEPSSFVCLVVHDKGQTDPAFQQNFKEEEAKPVIEYRHGFSEAEAPLYFADRDLDHGWGAFRSCLEAVEEKLKNPVRIGDNLLLDVFRSWKQIDDRLARAIVAQHVVVTDPEIRGGEPVVRGTRIPAYLLHDLAEQGATEDELLADYPAIDRHRLGFVLLYTRTHPRPGRPRKRPWSSQMGAS
jgi:uncharacterized protein (DUF433 family)